MKKRLYLVPSPTASGPQVEECLRGRMDNRVRVLIFGKLDLVRLRYLTPGFKFRECAAISYVQLTIGDSGATVDRFKVDLKQMLVFQEDREHLVAWLVMADLPTTIILSLIEQHQYPQLPRLSNQREFGALCPKRAARRESSCAGSSSPGTPRSSVSTARPCATSSAPTGSALTWCGSPACLPSASSSSSAP